MQRRSIWAAYGAVLVVAGLGLRQMWQYHYDTNLLAAQERISGSIRQVENLIATGLGHVNLLRISADDTLSDIKGGGFSVSPLYRHIRPAPQFDGYCSERNGAMHGRSEVAISGLGAAPVAGTQPAQEINMALLLNAQFAATAESIPSLAWAYYTSARRFIAMYPFVSCADFHFTDELLAHEFFRLGTPEFNPQRRTFWTQAYMDEAGKGLMATVGAPIYDGGRFLGTVAIDLTLEVLSEYVRDPDDRIGTAFIVNEQGQLLAHPALIGQGDTAARDIEEAFADRLADPRAAVLAGPEDVFADHAGTLVYASRFRGAPWHYVYTAGKADLYWRALLDSKIEVGGFLMLMLLIAAFERSRQAGLRLRCNVAQLEQAQTSLQIERDRAEKAETAARQANLAKSVMLANASHDLRTPLNAIIGFSELVLSRPYGEIGSPKYDEYIRDIHASGNLLLAIINDVLDLSKVEAGRYEINEQDLQVAKLVETSSRLVSTQAEQSGIELQVDVAANLPPLRADLRAMQQILLNLLSNAIKFTPPGGKVVVRVGLDHERALRLEISDTGKGISAEDLRLLFTPFSRGASASTANTQGTGLGLAIVKSLVELHGGSIAIASTPGDGTTVTVTFAPERVRAAAGDVAA